MKNTKIVIGCILSGVLSFGAMAQSKIYLEVDGIQSEALSFSWSASRDISFETGRPTTSRAVFESLNLSRDVDAQSATFMQDLFGGQEKQMVEIRATQINNVGQEVDFIRYELERVYVSSYSISSAADTRPVENLSFTFGRFRVTVTELDESGKVGQERTYCWDATANQECSAQGR